MIRLSELLYITAKGPVLLQGDISGWEYLCYSTGLELHKWMLGSDYISIVDYTPYKLDLALTYTVLDQIESAPPVYEIVYTWTDQNGIEHTGKKCTCDIVVLLQQGCSCGGK